MDMECVLGEIRINSHVCLRFNIPSLYHSFRTSTILGFIQKTAQNTEVTGTVIETIEIFA